MFVTWPVSNFKIAVSDKNQHLLSFLSAACNCDSVGGVSGGECEGKTDPDAGLVAGRCICKTNVEGNRCNKCKPNFWNIQKSNPDGCEGNNTVSKADIFITCDQAH